VEHLHLAQEILRLGHGVKPLPILDQLVYRVGKKIAHLETGLAAGDELTVLEFLRRDIEPLFPHMQEFGPDVNPGVPSGVGSAHGDPLSAAQSF
jgi:hypothetical protein